MPDPIPEPTPAPAGTKGIIAQMQKDLAEVIRVQKALLEAIHEIEDYEAFDFIERGNYHGIQFR